MPNTPIHLNPINPGQKGTPYEVLFGTKYVGDVYIEVDGYYVFVPDGSGFMDEYFLYTMFDLLKTLNKPWDTKIQNDPKIPEPVMPGTVDFPLG